MVTDAPEIHRGYRLREHAFVDLGEEFFDHAATGFCAEHGKRGAAAESLLGFFKPVAGAVDAGEDLGGHIEEAHEASEFVGLVRREALAAGAAMLEGARRYDDVVHVFERDTGAGDEVRHRFYGDAGFDGREIEMQRGEERLG